MAKSLVLKAANRMGVSHAVASSRWRQQRLLVLCYHGISQYDEHEWSDLYVSPEHFERRLALLKQMSANIVPLDDALTMMYAGTLPPRAVSLTFDDGCCDFASRAAPMMAAASAHSTLYLCTYYCRKRLAVFDPFVSYILWKARDKRVRLPGLERTVDIPSTATDPAFIRMHFELLAFAAAADMSAEEKHAFARAIAEAGGVDFDALDDRRILHLLNPEEVRALDPAMVSVQLHTHRHRTPSTLEGVQEELTLNAEEIMAMTGRPGPLNHFCYPSGVFSPQFTDWLETHGVRSATTCEPGFSTRMTSPLVLPRFVDTMGVSPDTFRAWISGSAALTQLRRWNGHVDVPG